MVKWSSSVFKETGIDRRLGRSLDWRNATRNIDCQDRCSALLHLEAPKQETNAPADPSLLHRNGQ
jgi:hypothetical protein